MNCEFNSVQCSTQCPKFAICMYKNIQTQLSEINSQLNFILKAITHLTCEEGINKERLSVVEDNITDIVSTLIELTNDSDTIHEITRSQTHEKVNQREYSSVSYKT